MEKPGMHTARPTGRRRLLAAWVAPLLAMGLANVLPAAAQTASSDPWAALREDGAIVLFRHAEAPGIGDPGGFRLGDCTTQRNLSEAGRKQARRSGESLRQQRIPVGAVWASQWCRTRDTAALMDLGPVREEPAFNSFFDERGDQAAQTAAARRKLLDWHGPGALVVVTHQVNITALTGLGVASAEGIVLQRRGDTLAVTGRIAPPR